jgi:hypothetical protein
MPVSIYKRLEALANGRVMITLGVIFVALTMLFPWVARQLGSTGMIDSHLSYTPGEVHQYIASYSDAGRSLHLIATLTADLAYPVDYSLLFALLIISTYHTAFPSSRMARPMSLFPFLTAIFDLLENTGIVIMLASYPQQKILVAQAAGLFTSLKFGFLAITLVLVLVGVAGLGLTKLKPK